METGSGLRVADDAPKSVGASFPAPRKPSAAIPTEVVAEKATQAGYDVLAVRCPQCGAAFGTYEEGKIVCDRCGYSFTVKAPPA